jgi:hypothetical protein
VAVIGALDRLRGPAMVILVVDDVALDSCPRLDRAQPAQSGAMIASWSLWSLWSLWSTQTR